MIEINSIVEHSIDSTMLFIRPLNTSFYLIWSTSRPVFIGLIIPTFNMLNDIKETSFNQLCGINEPINLQTSKYLLISWHETFFSIYFEYYCAFRTELNCNQATKFSVKDSLSKNRTWSVSFVNSMTSFRLSDILFLFKKCLKERIGWF